MRVLEPKRIELKPSRFATLGETLAAYRRRCYRQIQPHLPWAQEDLAFACETSQAQISRIESNRQIPDFATLVHICDAMRVSTYERVYLFALAGYQVAPPLPDEDDVKLILAPLARCLNSCPYPVILQDDAQRTWYVNELAAMVWAPSYGVTDRSGWMEQIGGRPSIEVIFDPALFDRHLRRWETFHVDLERVLMRHVVALWRAYRIHPSDPLFSAILDHLEENPAFRQRWDQVSSGGYDLAPGGPFAHSLRHSMLGRLCLQTWHTRAAIDERFDVIHFTPADEATAHVFGRLAIAR